MANPLVFLDTNIFKFSASEIEQFVGEEKTINWGGNELQISVYKPCKFNPNDNLKNERMIHEVSYLEKLAELGISQKVNYVTHHEVRFESISIPHLNTKRGLFYGAPVNMVPGPVEYSRIIMGGRGELKDEQYGFISSISNPEFIDIQKIVGAYQGVNQLPSHNQLLDAFHLWTAESAGCDFFLTLDLKLVKMVHKSKTRKVDINVVTPSGLFKLLK